ncbi:MAG: hypothetical protein EOP93_18865, partial [Lysobacteraceae bacterium]
MSRIDIRHAHSLPRAKARKAVEEVANKLGERFQMECAWDGDVLNFSRSGVDGHIELGKDDLHVTAKLGFLMAMFKDPLDLGLDRVLEHRHQEAELGGDVQVVLP